MPDAATDRPTFVAAVYSDAGNCFFIRDWITIGIGYAVLRDAAPGDCTAGNAASVTFGTRWPSCVARALSSSGVVAVLVVLGQPGTDRDARAADRIEAQDARLVGDALRPAGDQPERGTAGRLLALGPTNDVGVVLVHRGGDLVADGDAGGDEQQ